MAHRQNVPIWAGKDLGTQTTLEIVLFTALCGTLQRHCKSPGAPRPAPSAPAGGAYLGACVLRGRPARRLHGLGSRALGCRGLGFQHLGHGRRRYSGERS